MVLMRQAKDYHKYIGAEVFMRVFNRNKALSEILAQKTFILSTLKHLLANYDVLSATRIEAMRNNLARLEALGTADAVPHAAPAAAPAIVVEPTPAATSNPESPSKGDEAKKTRVPIVVTTDTSASATASGTSSGYNPTALLAMLEQLPQQPATATATAAAATHSDKHGKHRSKSKKHHRSGTQSAISADALNALNAGVDDDDSHTTDSGSDSGALPPPVEPATVLRLDDHAVASIMEARERDQWSADSSESSIRSTATGGGGGGGSHLVVPGAKPIAGTVAPAPSVAVADLEELRRQVQIMATAADVDDNDDDDAAAEEVVRAVPKKLASKGHVAPAPTAATGELENFRAQAQAMAAAAPLELDAAMVDKILNDRKRGAFGGELGGSDSRSGSSISVNPNRVGITAPRSTAAPADLHDYKDAAMQLAQRLAAIAGADDDSDSASAATASSLSEASPRVSVHTPTKNDPKRLRALAFTPSQPPSTGINTQLLDFKSQAEALAAQLAEAAAADAEHDDALSSGESARDDDGDDPASADTTETSTKHGSLRDPIEKQMHTSAKKKAALKYTPKAPAPTGSAPEMSDFRSQAMQLADQLRSLATTDDSADSAESSSLPGSEQSSANTTLRLPDGVRAPAPTMKEKQLASYAAQAELLVAKLAEVDRVRKSEAASNPRRHRSRSHKVEVAAAAAAAAEASTASAAAHSPLAASVTAQQASSSTPVVERLRTAALVRKNSKGDNDSGSSSPLDQSPVAQPPAPTVAEDKPQRRSTKSKTNQPVMAAAAVAALVQHTSSENLHKEAAKDKHTSAENLHKEAAKDKAAMGRRPSVSVKPAGRAPLPPRSDKELQSAMELETELSAQRADLKKKIEAIEASWASKPKDEKALHELMQLGLTLADVEAQLADLQNE